MTNPANPGVVRPLHTIHQVAERRQASDKKVKRLIESSCLSHTYLVLSGAVNADLRTFQHSNHRDQGPRRRCHVLTRKVPLFS
jgi:hypothetical protein